MTWPVVALVAFSVSLASTPLLARVGRRVGLVDRPDDEGLSIHADPIPTTGGLAVIAAVGISSGFAGGAWPGIAAATIGAALVLGLVDDLIDASPWTRVVAFAGIAAVGAAAQRTWPERLVALLLLAATPNGVNLADGRDGLAASVAAICAAGLAVAVGGGPAAAAGTAAAAALVGFLVWNRPPARVFLGNGGAYAVGMLLAWVAIALVRAREVAGLVSAGACLAPFAFELLATIRRRIVAGRPLLSGDRDHLYDRLAVRFGEWPSLALAAGGAAVLSIAGAVVAFTGSH